MVYPWVFDWLQINSKVFMPSEMGNIKRNFMGYLKVFHVFFRVKIHEKPVGLGHENQVKTTENSVEMPWKISPHFHGFIVVRSEVTFVWSKVSLFIEQTGFWLSCPPSLLRWRSCLLCYQIYRISHVTEWISLWNQGR